MELVLLYLFSQLITNSTRSRIESLQSSRMSEKKGEKFLSTLTCTVWRKMTYAAHWESGDRRETLAGRVCKISFNNDHTYSNSYNVIHTRAHTMVQQFSSLALMVTLSANTWIWVPLMASGVFLLYLVSPPTLNSPKSRSLPLQSTIRWEGRMDNSKHTSVH